MINDRVRLAVRVVLIAVAAAGLSGDLSASRPSEHVLRYEPAPVDNPLKGLTPYARSDHSLFPHSMEFDYLPLSALLVGPDEYDWTALERLLDGAAGRGRQTVFRVHMEWPGRKGLIPKFLIDQGLKVHRYPNTNTQPFPPREVETPDYEDPKLRSALVRFIQALGRRYDGDPRIGFITAGLLGTWGEWHDHPRSELFASKAVQKEVMDAYEASFKITPVLLRYPAGEADDVYAANADRPFGYHDDSFAWATLNTGRRRDAWFFVPTLHRAGPGAVEKWKTRPIGGEIRPEAWGVAFDADPGDSRIQDFERCVRETHVTWLMDSGMFRRGASAERRRRAEAMVRMMGYEFHVPAVAWEVGPEKRLLLRVDLVNRGVAPFYHDWSVEYGLLGADGDLVQTAPGRGKLAGLLPDAPARTWEEEIDLTAVPPGDYRLLLRAPNPMPGGRTLRFANAEQDRDRPGWLTLVVVTAP